MFILHIIDITANLKRKYLFYGFLLFSAILNGQSTLRLQLEPVSGFTWSKTTYRYNPNRRPIKYINYYIPGNYTGLAINLEKARWSMGFEKSGRAIKWRLIEFYSYDTFTTFSRTYISINRFNISYRFIQRKKWLSKLMFSYAIPARTGSILYKDKEIDAAGKQRTLDDFWYQRSGA